MNKTLTKSTSKCKKNYQMYKKVKMHFYILGFLAAANPCYIVCELKTYLKEGMTNMNMYKQCKNGENIDGIFFYQLYSIK